MFTAKERDYESGEDYFGARYYGSALGRWTSPDDFKDSGITDPSTGKVIFSPGPLPYADIYDQFGNMWIAGSTGITPAGNSPTGAGSYNSKNRITTGSATFDAAGNQTFANGNTPTYDAENRQISETDGTTKAVTNYIYDGDGRRVEKIGPNATVV